MQLMELNTLDIKKCFLFSMIDVDCLFSIRFFEISIDLINLKLRSLLPKKIIHAIILFICSSWHWIDDNTLEIPEK